MFTPLTEEQFNKAIKAGFEPSQIIANEQKRKQEETVVSAPSQPSPQQPGFFQSALQGAAQPFLQGARFPLGMLQMGIGKLTGSQQDVQRGADLAGNNPVDFGALGKVNAAGYDENGKSLSIAGATGQAVGAGMQIAPWMVGAGEAGNLAQNAARNTIGGLIKAGAKTGAILGGTAGAGQAIQQGSETGRPANETAATAVSQGVMGAATGGLLGAGIGATGGILGKVAGKVNTQAAINDAVDSVNPDITGKRLAGAYESAAKRGSYSGGSTPGIDPRVSKMGTELSDLNLRPTDPRGNLVKLERAMNETEYKIKPFENYGVSPGIKRVLTNDLESLKTQIPREFQRIGDTTSAFNDVVDFGKEIVGQSKDTIGGYRNARTAFDMQAKTQFPNAFNDNGTVNIKTPAGTAIKLVRDTMNGNLYQIAPSNSNLQGLIGREADIYNAIHNVAPKVAKINGLSGYNLFVKQHPTIARIVNIGKWALPLGAAGVGGGLIEHLVSGSNQ